MEIDTDSVGRWLRRNWLFLFFLVIWFDGFGVERVRPSKDALLGRRVPLESFAPRFDGHAVCDRTPAGWLRISGRLFPGDGFRHSVVGKCVDDGYVIIVRDQPDNNE